MNQRGVFRVYSGHFLGWMPSAKTLQTLRMLWFSSGFFRAPFSRGTTDQEHEGIAKAIEVDLASIETHEDLSPYLESWRNSHGTWFIGPGSYATFTTLYQLRSQFWHPNFELAFHFMAWERTLPYKEHKPKQKSNSDETLKCRWQSKRDGKTTVLAMTLKQPSEIKLRNHELQQPEAENEHHDFKSMPCVTSFSGYGSFRLPLPWPGTIYIRPIVNITKRIKHHISWKLIKDHKSICISQECAIIELLLAMT